MGPRDGRARTACTAVCSCACAERSASIAPRPVGHRSHNASASAWITWPRCSSSVSICAQASKIVARNAMTRLCAPTIQKMQITSAASRSHCVELTAEPRAAPLAWS
jgi:hypothetical protein